MGLWTDEPEMLGGSNKRTGPQGGVRQTITIATRTREALRLRGDVAQATSVRPACLSLSREPSLHPPVLPARESMYVYGT